MSALPAQLLRSGLLVHRHQDPEGNAGAGDGTRPSAVAEPSGEQDPAPSVPKRNKRVRPRTYSVAVYIVIGLLIAEVIALFSIFHFRRVVINISTQAPPILAQNQTELEGILSSHGETSMTDSLNPLMPESILSRIKQAGEGEEVVSVMSQEEIAVEEDPEKLALARQEAERLAAERAAAAAREAAEEQARQVSAYLDQSDRFLREEDIANAKRMLQRALAADRDNVETLQRLALLTTQEGRPNEALQHWRRIVALGPEAGDAYVLAKDEVAATQARAKIEAARVSAEAGGNLAKRFMISGLKKTVGTDPEFADQLKLEFDIAFNGITREDLDEMFIEFFFYDQMPGKVVPGAGRIAVEPVGTETEWLDNGGMKLTATYELDEEMAQSTNRRYKGFLLRLYLNQQLQDEQSEPAELLYLVKPTY